MADNFNVVAAAGATVTLSAKDTGAGVMATDHRVTDGAGHYLPAGDAAARAAYVIVTDGTNTLKTMDVVGRAGFVKLTDGTNTAPTLDVAARKGFVAVTDGTNTISVNASNAALDETAAKSLRVNAIGYATDAAGAGASQLVPLQVESTAQPNLKVSVWNSSHEMPAMDAAARPGFVKVTDGTNALPTGDVAARKIFVTLTDGTGTAGFDNANTTPKVSLYGKGAAAGDTAINAGDSQAHGINVVVGDGTNVAAVKAASTGSALTDKSLVVAPSANCPLSKPTAGAPVRVSAKTSIKGAAGALFGLTIINTTASTRWVQLFDVATTGGVNLGTTLPDLEFQVAANSTLTVNLPAYGWPFGLGLIYAATTAEGGATPGSAGDVLLFPTYA